MRPSRVAIAVFLVAGLAMFLNEARLERSRPRKPQPGHQISIAFKDRGYITHMFLTGDDERIRLGLVAIILAALGTCVWLERRGR